MDCPEASGHLSRRVGVLGSPGALQFPRPVGAARYSRSVPRISPVIGAASCICLGRQEWGSGGKPGTGPWFFGAGGVPGFPPVRFRIGPPPACLLA
jgi:hypothetical protein